MALDLTNGKIADYDNLLLCVDGGSQPKNPGVAACGWVILDENKNTLVEECRIVSLNNTNNFAEYCGLGFSLKWLKDQNWRGNLTVQADSQLLIYQVIGKWKCKALHLSKLRERIWNHLDDLNMEILDDQENLFAEADKRKNPCVFKWVRREMNSYADGLSDAAFAQHFRPINPAPPNFMPLEKKNEH